LRGVLSLVMQILGLTWANVRARLVRATSETVVAALETGFELVVTLVREGPAAAWRQLMEHLGNLRDMVMGQVRDWVASTVVGQAVTRIASMLNPAGAVIQAIIAIYNTVMFVRERLQQIVQVAESFINGIAAIAAGNISAAADRVEQTMGRLVPVVISFLARLLGLGGIGDTIRNILARVRAPVERAIDRVVAWIVTQARRVGSAVAGAARGAVARVTQWWTARRSFRADDGEHSLYIEGSGRNRRVMMASAPAQLRQRLTALNPPAPRRPNKTRALEALTQLEEAMRVADGTGPAAADAGARVQQAIDRIGAECAVLFSGAPADGLDPSRPIEIDWVKPAVTDYPVLRLRDPDLVRRQRAGEPGIQQNLPRTFDAHPTAATVLHDGSVLGVRDPVSLSLRVGATFPARAPTSGDTVKNRLNRILRNDYGYERRLGPDESFDTDHIWEKQLGGADAMPNLWPLDSSRNRSSGSIVNAEIDRVRRELSIPASVNKLAGRWVKLRARG
jgi:hypothetical protein